MDLTKFNYPMFSTTDREKEILRMAELAMIDQTHFTGLCVNLSMLLDSNKITYTEYEGLCSQLRMVINHRFMYIDSSLFTPYCSPNHKIRRLLRRIWITKLLNYRG